MRRGAPSKKKVSEHTKMLKTQKPFNIGASYFLLLSSEVTSIELWCFLCVCGGGGGCHFCYCYAVSCSYFSGCNRKPNITSLQELPVEFRVDFKMSSCLIELLVNKPLNMSQKCGFPARLASVFHQILLKIPKTTV